VGRLTAPVRWGILGVGVAGRARGRAIAADPACVLVGGVRGRPAEIGAAEFPSAEALIAAVDAVAVCAPDAAHAALVGAALGAGKAVLVEYPLAPRPPEAAALIGQAAAAGLPLLVEHIELLTPQARFLRGRAAGRTLLGGSLRGAVPAREPGVGVAQAHLARLHRLVDAVGFPTRVDVLERQPGRVVARFLYPGRSSRVPAVGAVDVELVMGDGARRRTELALELHDGTVMQLDQTVLDGGAPVSLPAGEGLFARCHAAAMATLTAEAPFYVGLDRELALLRLAAALDGEEAGGTAAAPG